MFSLNVSVWHIAGSFLFLSVCVMRSSVSGSEVTKKPNAMLHTCRKAFHLLPYSFVEVVVNPENMYFELHENNESKFSMLLVS